jgi:parallel beta-helix repeat protein
MSIGQVILVRCKNIVVKNLHLSNATIGIELWETNNSKIIKNKIENNDLYGIVLVNSSSNLISGNEIKNNKHGIYFTEYSNHNKIFHNAFIKNEFQARYF